MLSKHLAYGLAMAAGLALTSAARAGDDDVIRLAPPSSSGDVRTLGATADDLAADNLDAAYRGGGYHGGYRGGYYGGYRGGYRGGYYGGYRGGYYGGYRGGYYGGYRGGYGGYYRPYYASYYRPYYGYNRGYYANYSPYLYGGYGYGGYGYGGYGYGGIGYGGYGGYYGCSTGAYPIVSQYAYTQPILSSVTPYGPHPPIILNGNSTGNPYATGKPYGNGYQQPMPPPVAPGNGTYPYDGGPNQPVPMPQQQISPTKTAPSGPVADLRLVSTTSRQTTQQQPSTFAYPAYGEDTRASGFAIDRTAKKTSR
jgi:hypothetical protein